MILTDLYMLIGGNLILAVVTVMFFLTTSVNQ